jgi:hypothetical protein
MNYQYSYLIGTLALLIIWLILYYCRRDIRKEIFIVSLIFGIAGLAVDPIYSSDWWFPLTLTNTMPGIESFIFGFCVGGIASIIYEILFKKRIRLKKLDNFYFKKSLNLLVIGILMILLFYFEVEFFLFIFSCIFNSSSYYFI